MREKISFLKGQKFSLRKIGIDKLLYCLLAGVVLLIISIPTSTNKESELDFLTKEIENFQLCWLLIWGEEKYKGKSI